MPRRPRLVYATTLPVTARLLLRGQLARMREWGFDVHVVTSPGPELDVVRDREGVDVHPLEIPREVEPRGDAVALARLVRLFRRLKPDIVNASTPKAGLLGMLAARIARVPVRIYLLRGLRLETAEGALRRVLDLCEKAAAASAHDVICVSRSLERAFVDGGFAPARKCSVLGAGSSNGVDAARYARTPEVERAARQLLDRLAIPRDAPRIGFAGRLVADKGITPLLDAFSAVRASHPDARLLLVGDDLAGDSVAPDVRARVAGDPAIHVLPRMDDLAPFYAALDVFAFPSLREGFPNVPVEAAAAEVPVVGFPSTGVVDAVLDGVTGAIVSPDAAGLARGLLAYLADPALRRAHGVAGRERVLRDFPPERVWALWRDLYVDRLRAAGLPLPEA